MSYEFFEVLASVEDRIGPNGLFGRYSLKSLLNTYKSFPHTPESFPALMLVFVLTTFANSIGSDSK
jgi:hypothetical protein